MDRDEVTGYSARHGVEAAPFLTMTDPEAATLLVDGLLAPRIAGKTVIEVGGGLGIVSLLMGRYAKRVFCVEANPVWVSGQIRCLMEHKPRNVSYLFGDAAEFHGLIRGDVALYLSHSGLRSLDQLARGFAPDVIDVYSEMIARNPEAFDPLARILRQFT